MHERVARCHLIASVLAADGIMTPGEQRFLQTAMDRWELTAQEREAVRHFEGGEEPIDVVRALPESERRAMLDELTEAALVDGRLGPHELQIVNRLSKALDLA